MNTNPRWLWVMNVTKWLACGLLVIMVIVPVIGQSGGGVTLPHNLDVITADNADAIGTIARINADIRHISSSPDGTLLAVGSQHVDNNYNITIQNIQTGETVSSMQGRMDSFHELVWSPDSSRIAVISGRMTGGGVVERSIKTYTIERGADPAYYVLGESDTWYVDYVDITQFDTSNHIQAVWNPASALLVVVLFNRIEIYDVEADVQLFSTQRNGIQTVNWTANGRLLIIHYANREVELWGIASE